MPRTISGLAFREAGRSVLEYLDCAEAEDLLEPEDAADILRYVWCGLGEAAGRTGLQDSGPVLDQQVGGHPLQIQHVVPEAGCPAKFHHN